MCNPILKALNVYSAFIPFFSLFSGIDQNWAKCDIFFPIYFVSFLLSYFAVVVFIKKALKLLKLVLVVYCTSGWQWSHPGELGSLKTM